MLLGGHVYPPATGKLRKWMTTSSRRKSELAVSCTAKSEPGASLSTRSSVTQHVRVNAASMERKAAAKAQQAALS